MSTPVYISSRFHYLLSWVSFIIGLLLLTMILALLYFFVLSNFEGWAFFNLSVILTLIALTSVPGIKSRGIIIENDKILIKGIFGTTALNVSNFNAIYKKWWQPYYTIAFNNGLSFIFKPNSEYTLVTLNSMFTDKISDGTKEMNDLINSLKDKK